MSKKKRTTVGQFPLADHIQMELGLPLEPSFLTGVSSLMQGMMDIFTVQPLFLPQLSINIDDRAALVGDMRKVLIDGFRAHADLLRSYPRLIR